MRCNAMQLLELGDVANEYWAAPFTWTYHRLPLAMHSATLQLIVQRTHGDGDPDVYVRFGSLPTLHEFDDLNLDCDPCGQEHHVLELALPTRPYIGSLFVGVYVPCCTSAKYAIQIRVQQCECVNRGCSNGGRCNAVCTCECGEGFSGSDCKQATASASASSLLLPELKPHVCSENTSKCAENANDGSCRAASVRVARGCAASCGACPSMPLLFGTAGQTGAFAIIARSTLGHPPPAEARQSN